MLRNIVFQKTVSEFFAGIGLMRAGLDEAGWKTTFANDIDLTKQKLYLNNYSESSSCFVLRDIHNLSSNHIPTTGLATASFPCTDLSLAGKRAGLNGKQSSAFWGFVRLLNDMNSRKPPLILLENVAGFLNSNGGNDLKEALVSLNKLGYSIDIFLINAAHFVPQSRVRLFILGKLKPRDSFQLKHYLPVSDLRPQRLRDFIYEHPEINWDINMHLPPLPTLNTSLETIVENIDNTSKLWWSRERIRYFLSQTSEKHFSKLSELKEDENIKYLTAFRRVRNGKTRAEVRFDGIAGCLRTPKGGSAKQILLEVGKGEINIRLFTPIECANLMGAQNFKLSGTTNEALFGFGDAVCVPVIKWIAENYLNAAFASFLETNNVPTQYAESA